MSKLYHKYVSIVLTLMFTSCGLLGSYDQVSLMAGIQIPLYSEQVNIGLKLDLKDQAINKLQEQQKTMSIEAWNKFLDWKTSQGAKK